MSPRCVSLLCDNPVFTPEVVTCLDLFTTPPLFLSTSLPLLTCWAPLLEGRDWQIQRKGAHLCP